MANRSIEIFIAVYEERSFTRAAIRENATQSGVSQHVRRIEQRHDVCLFERKGIEVKPTTAGHRFYRRCIALLRTEQEAFAELREFATGLTGEASVGVPPALSGRAVASAILAFKELHPNTTVRVTENVSGVLHHGVLSGEFDFAVATSDVTGDAGLMTSHFMSTDYVLVSRVDGPDISITRYGDIPPLKLVLPQPGGGAQILHKFFKANGIPIGESLEIGSLTVSLDLVAQSDWVTILPRLLVTGRLHSSDLKLGIIEPVLATDLLLISAARKVLSPVANAFLQTLRDQCLKVLAEQMQIFGRTIQLPQARDGSGAS